MSVAYEQAQDRARVAAEEIEAPPCSACGEPVADEHWDAHRRLEHGLGGPQPYGRPKSREALFIADTADEINQKISRWRDEHPGLGLLHMGEGFEKDFRMCWVRFRVLTPKGRRAQ